MSSKDPKGSSDSLSTKSKKKDKTKKGRKEGKLREHPSQIDVFAFKQFVHLNFRYLPAVDRNSGATLIVLRQHGE